MFCPNCGQQTEQGKICTNCGANLSPEQHAATSEPTDQATNENEQQGNTAPAQPNEFVEAIKKESVNFGKFFMRMLKRPDEARKINSSNMTSAIITMVIFSLLIALGTYLVGQQLSSSFSFFSPVQYSFFDSFFLPLIQILVLFAIVIALTFGGSRVAAQSISFTDVVSKVGAYTVPFLIIMVIGSLLGLIGFLTLAALVIIVGLLGPIVIVPTFVLLEQPTNGFDRLYVLLGIYIVSLFISAILVQKILMVFASGVIGGFGF